MFFIMILPLYIIIPPIYMPVLFISLSMAKYLIKNITLLCTRVKTSHHLIKQITCNRLVKKSNEW